MSVDRRAFLAGSSRLLSASLLAAGVPAAAEAENQPQTANRKYRLIATEEALDTEKRDAERSSRSTAGGGEGGRNIGPLLRVRPAPPPPMPP